MNYEETLAFLFSQLPMFQRQGPVAYKKDLGNIRQLCAALNHPEHQFKSVHIAGTNGKGSVSHIMASVLQESGYRVGLYTSPHLMDFRERIRVNGVKIPENTITRFVDQHQDLIQRIQPSFFEITVAMAFDHFAEEAVDVAVIETGLGGRLDSTNIIHPELCVITNIGWDHSDMLG
ncbi:MAG: bifunctional folylpolyglutamate synthase/dihydrofolate synthase, partial [Bacteroidetes bacterium]|nr:bifunctional folylpolyglutamate synthase/dihydrofolate synthase [Bacteroidota bacterium]